MEKSVEWDEVQRRVRELEEENGSLRRAVHLLHRVASLVRDTVEFEPSCYALLTGVTAGEGLGLNRAMLFLVEQDREVLRGAAAVGPADAQEADRVWRSIEADSPDLETLHEAGLAQLEHPGELDRLVRATRIEVNGDTPVARALRSGEVIQGAGSDDLGGLFHLPTAVAAPLRGRSTQLGVLYGDSLFTGRRLSPVSLMVLSLLADQGGRAFEIARQFEKVALAARTDALTGLPHHGALMEELVRSVASAQRRAEPMGVVMVDLDDFKRVNDTLGHLAGDALLAAVAERLREVARATEQPFRYGGEEFTLLLTSADQEQATAVGERLREAVGGRPFAVPGGALQVTCSVGVASFPEDGHDATSLVAAADAALLRAKALGKDRVERAVSEGGR